MDYPILWPTLLGPLEEGIRVAAGEILEEEAVTRVEQEEEEAVETHTPLTTNSQGNSPLSSKEIAESQRRSYRNGTSIGVSIDSPLK